MVKKRSSIEENLPRLRHYIADRGVRTAIYVYAASVSETHHVLRYSMLYVPFFLFFRRCKDKEFYRNYQTFSEKNSFLREYFCKKLAYINISLYFCSEILIINSK